MSSELNSAEFRISPATVARDLTASVVVFLVALPLCLGIASASGAPPIAGLLAGIVGGLVVGSISGSHTSVSGPAAGLITIVAAQISGLGSFEAFLLAVVIGGFLQIGLGIVRAGALSAFFPSSVIKGLLAAIGVILILKEIPHLFGHDAVPEGDMAYSTAHTSDHPNPHDTFSDLFALMDGDIHFAATTVGLAGIALLLLWDRLGKFKNIVPGPLVAVLTGVFLQQFLKRFGSGWTIEGDHLVKIPVAETASDLLGFLTHPDFSQFNNPAVYVAGLTIAIVASLETLLNLEAVDKLDPERRNSPPSRELLAQGAGNVVAGMIGGLPVTSVIVRSSVNVGIGAKTKLSTISHGVLLLVCVALFPVYLNMIPRAALAAILIVTGFKLANPKLFTQMLKEGPYQYLPFFITLASIVFTDLLIGILIGLGVSVIFILKSNLRRPIRRIVETHVGGSILHIELANQVSFLNRAAIDRLFREAKRGTHLLIDATDTDYIDPDVLSLIRDFKDNVAAVHGVTVSVRGFRKKYQMHDEVEFADYTTRELQDRVTPHQVIDILIEGNRRFRTGHRLSRDFSRQISATRSGQNPLAVVLGCIDSRVPAEHIFDLGIGDIFTARVAGNVVGTKTIGSIEYAVSVAGVKLVVVLGHTGCGAVTSSLELLCEGKHAHQETGCEHLHAIVDELTPSVREEELRSLKEMDPTARKDFIDEVAERNVHRTVHEITERSTAIREAIETGQIMVIGAMYDIRSGHIEFMLEEARSNLPLG